MNKPLEDAIRGILREANALSTDTHGYLQHLPAHVVVILHLEFEKWCRKHGKPGVTSRGSGAQSAASA